MLDAIFLKKRILKQCIKVSSNNHGPVFEIAR